MNTFLPSIMFAMIGLSLMDSCVKSLSEEQKTNSEKFPIVQITSKGEKSLQ
jgi:hypothetical protein